MNGANSSSCLLFYLTLVLFSTFQLLSEGKKCIFKGTWGSVPKHKSTATAGHEAEGSSVRPRGWDSIYMCVPWVQEPSSWINLNLCYTKANSRTCLGFPIVDAIPKKSELQDHDIIDNIVADYSIVGTCLLNDDYGNKIKGLEEEYRSRSVTALVGEIFRLWTAGNGATPISWEGLVICLQSAKLNRLADEITSAYCVEKRTDSYTGSHGRSRATMADPDEGSIKGSQTGFLTEMRILFILCCSFFVATIVVVTLFVISWHYYSPGMRLFMASLVS